MHGSKSSSDKTSSSSIGSIYLTVYNGVMLLACNYIFWMMLYSTVGVSLWNQLQSGRPFMDMFFDTKFHHTLCSNFSKSFSLIGRHLAYIQAATVLEVLHALFGITNSAVLPNLLQVAGRNIVIWIYVIMFGNETVQSHCAFPTMASAWMIADMIRYSYYLVPSFSLIKWFRYTMFYILYPIGASAEFYLIVLSNESMKLSCYYKCLSHLYIALFLPGT